MRKRKTGALAVLLVFMMAFANIFGMMPAISVAAQEEKQQEVTVERASELVYGEQYLLVGEQRARLRAAKMIYTQWLVQQPTVAAKQAVYLIK